jgi:hypothetical protein
MSEADGRLPSETVPFHVCRIIAGALIAGPLIFAGIAHVSGLGQPPQPGSEIIGYIAVAFSVIDLIASFIVPTVVANQTLAQLAAKGSELTTKDYFGVYQTRMLIRAALLEGAAFFCCIIYMSSRLWWTLATALFLVLVMAIVFPTRGRFDDWIRERREADAFDAAPDTSDKT